MIRNFLFGMETSGSVFVFTDALKSVKHITNPSPPKLQPNSGLYDLVSRTVGNIVGFFNGRSSQVFPNLDSEPTNLLSLPREYKSIFPYLTATSDGLATLCTLSPEDCFIFLTSYETALRNKSIANIRESQVPGQWYHIIMDRNIVTSWLQGRQSPFYEAKLCYFSDENRNSVIGGAMLYSVLEGNQLEIIYGVNTKSGDTFTLSWETIQYELDVDMGLLDTTTSNSNTRFIIRLSQDCSKLAIVVSTSSGFYTHVAQIPSHSGRIVKLERSRMTFCDHLDSEGSTSNRGCCIADVQWLVEDAYFACITCCGCLSIFHATGESMLIETSLKEEENDSSTFLPVLTQVPISRTKSKTKFPSLKWMDSEKILTCSTENTVEAFSIKRVISYRSRSAIVEPVTKTNNISFTNLRSPSQNSSVNLALSKRTTSVNEEQKIGFEPDAKTVEVETHCDITPVPSEVRIELYSTNSDDKNGSIIIPKLISNVQGFSNRKEVSITSLEKSERKFKLGQKETTKLVQHATLHEIGARTTSTNNNGIDKAVKCAESVSTFNDKEMGEVPTDLQNPLVSRLQAKLFILLK
ncbi:unnamed protein product [Orchesella dallaii]|uniref:Uncharacterized protein n=1 Tax=Orchesella dallaii TaxID=48710 RepID=A0ABP1S357_9HEXA